MAFGRNQKPEYSNQNPRIPMWFGVWFLLAGICFLLILVSAAFSQSFTRNGNPGDIKTGTIVTAESGVCAISYESNSVTQSPTYPADDQTLAVTSEYGNSLIYDPIILPVAPGAIVTFEYVATNEGNADDPNCIISKFYLLQLGANNWTVEAYMDGSFSETLEVDVVTSEVVTINEDNDYPYSFKVLVPIGTAEAPDGSKLVLWTTVETTSDPTPSYSGEYFGANKYEYGGYEKLYDYKTILIQAPVVTLTRESYVDAPDEYETNAGAGHENDPVPGAVITFTMTYDNGGSGDAKEVILIDKIPTGETYSTNLAHVNATGNRGTVTLTPSQGDAIGWTVYYTTDDPPSTTNYGEYTGWTLVGTLSAGDEDFPDSGLFAHGSPTFEARWIKWEKETVSGGEDARLVWGVTIR